MTNTKLAILENKRSVDPRRRQHPRGTATLRLYWKEDWRSVRIEFPPGCGWPVHAPKTPPELLQAADLSARHTQTPLWWSHNAAWTASKAHQRRTADIELHEGHITEQGHRNIRRSIRDREVLPLP